LGEEKLYFNRRFLILANFALLAWIFLASFCVVFYNQLYGWIYLVFLAFMVYVVLRRLGCSHCYNCKECTTGFGRLAGAFFGRGYLKKESVGNRVGLIAFIYVLLLPIPLVLVSINFGHAFSYLKLLVLACLLALAGYSLSTWFNRALQKGESGNSFKRKTKHLTHTRMVKMNPRTPKNRPLKLIVIISLVLIITAPALFARPAASQTEPSAQFYDKRYAWDYDGRHWTWNISIPSALYEAYKDVPVSTRTHNGPAGYGFLTTTQDYYVKMLTDKLNESANDMGYGSYDKVSFVLAFVQSLPYTSDNVTEGYNEYPRFPIETLVDDGGDCEDTSILFATITLIMGFGTVYINPPDHYAVGILGNNLHGTYWEYPEGSNRTYYYCETTGDGFKIGQLPDEFTGKTAYIYPIDKNTQYVPDVVVVPTLAPTQATVTSQGPTPQPTSTATPDVNDPNIQQVRPLSINLITDNPALFSVIIFAVVGSIGLAVWSVRRPKIQKAELAPSAPSDTQSTQNPTVENKYCIYCGSNNKGYASFCENCGKQIA
jgi:hypothetical protein